MKKIVITVFATLLAFSSVHAADKAIKTYGIDYFPGMEEFPKIRPIMHKKDLPVDFQPANLLHDSEKISNIHLRLITEKDPEGKKLQWDMGLPFRYVFLSRFAAMEKTDEVIRERDSWGRTYKYLEITFERADGSVLPPYRLFRNTINVNGINYFDTTKEIETWLFSTVNNYKQLLIVDTALNVDDFKRCSELGNLTHETDPEQCILPDGTTFLNVNATVKVDTIRTFSFDDCFANKNPLIEGYPRRCIAPGGHVYTEQPKIQ